MAKPILVIRVPFSFNDRNVDTVTEKAKSVTDNEYHIIIVAEDSTEIKFETYNDIKGLTDVDIEELIKTLK
jgi:hypothetical protein